VLPYIEIGQIAKAKVYRQKSEELREKEKRQKK
jgi:hypothetical protein